MRRSTYRSKAERGFGWWKKPFGGMEGSLGAVNGTGPVPK